MGTKKMLHPTSNSNKAFSGAFRRTIMKKASYPIRLDHQKTKKPILITAALENRRDI